MGLLVLLAGLPGAGKSTLTKRLAAVLEGRSALIVSSHYRKRLSLQDPFSLANRIRLQTELAQVVASAASDGTRFIILDSNLLERSARHVMVTAAGAGYETVFIGPHAERDILSPRVIQKFGVEYMYPEGIFGSNSVLDHSLAAGEPVTAQEASQLYSAVWSIDTGRRVVRSWTKGSKEADSIRKVEQCLVATQQEFGDIRQESLSLLCEEDLWMWDPEVDGLVARSPDRAVTYHRRRALLGASRSTLDPTATLKYAGSYLGTLRQRYGPGQLIVPSVRVVILDERRVLLVRRRDRREWGVVGGSAELNESLQECAAREVWEETGLEISALELVQVESGQKHVSLDPFGNCNQSLAFTYRSMSYRGNLAPETTELSAARWFGIDDLPDMPGRHHGSIRAAIEFSGRVREQ